MCCTCLANCILSTLFAYNQAIIAKSQYCTMHAHHNMSSVQGLVMGFCQWKGISFTVHLIKKLI